MKQIKEKIVCTINTKKCLEYEKERKEDLKRIEDA